MGEPSVSCVAVVDGAAPSVVARLAADFAAQTWPGRELVLMGRTDDARWMAELAAPLVKLIFDDGRPRMPGGRTQLALAHAAGDLVCVWRPGDRQHPSRLERQLRYIAGDAVGCCLTNRLVYFPTAHELGWIDHTIGPPQGCGGCIADTFLGWRSKMSWPDTNDARGLFQELTARYRVASVHDLGCLTIRAAMWQNDGFARARCELKRHGRVARELEAGREALTAAAAGYSGIAGQVGVCDGRTGARVYTIEFPD